MIVSYSAVLPMHTNYVLYKTYYWVHCWASESKRNLQALVLPLKGTKDKTHEHDLHANMEGNIFLKQTPTLALYLGDYALGQSLSLDIHTKLEIQEGL